jgi:hypothetical protein
MRPSHKRLEATIAKTQGVVRVIRVAGGVEGTPIVRVTHGNYVVIGPMLDLEIEDDREQAQAQAPDTSSVSITTSRNRKRRMKRAAQRIVDQAADLRLTREVKI